MTEHQERIIALQDAKRLVAKYASGFDSTSEAGELLNRVWDRLYDELNALRCEP